MNGQTERSWEELRRRRERLEQSLARDGDEEEGRRRVALRRRAEELAQAEAPGAAPPEERLELVAFTLGEERYAVETRHVEQVFAAPRLTPLPCVPSFVVGVVSLAGRIVSVVDLRPLFGAPSDPAAPRRRGVLIAGGDRWFALLADDVEGALSVPAGTLQREVSLANELCAAFTRGLLPDGRVVLNGEALLTDRRLVVSEEVLP